MSFLEYQDEMYLNAVDEVSGLIIASRGLGIEQLMVRLCRTYSDDTNLVIVIGTDQDEQNFFINQLLDQSSLPIGQIPRRITAESGSASKRREVYLKGGVLFVTERILVVDLLLDRVPIDLVTGFIVYRAHKVFDDCLMSFILRLYRLKNKKGFVCALSQSPENFIGEFGKLDKIMRQLFVTAVHLWPRFHATAQNCLMKAGPEVVEISLNMSDRMKKIQFCLIDILEKTIKDLSKTNTNFLIDFDKLNIENVLSMRFDKICRLFDSIWHQLSSRAKRLINDIQWLKRTLILLTRTDAITFYNHVRSAQETVRFGNEVSDWILLSSADQLFTQCKERVFPSETKDPKPEYNGKWAAFENLIDEIDRETSHIEETINVVVIVANDGVTKLLQTILDHGAENLYQNRLDRFLAIQRGCEVSVDVELESDSQDQTDKSAGPQVKKRSRTTKNPAAEKKLPDNIITLTQIFRRKQPQNEGEVIVITDSADESSGSEDSVKETKKYHQLKLHYFWLNQKNIVLESMLHSYKPSHVIMYDMDVCSMRKLEVYSATQCRLNKISLKIYAIQFKDSYDMQMYLTSLKMEKEAFESLIREKASLVVPVGRDGKTDGHPDLVRFAQKANETTEAANTRVGGGMLRNEILNTKILVDMREFRCELPSVVHKRGMEIIPLQLEIGDYILSSDTCVERKSISDLIQSLQSGRLHTQAETMIKHFKRAILLIEFDGNKSFHFKGRYISVGMGYDNFRSKEKRVDLIEKLILLTVHHPNLRILWSPSTYFTAELFEYLKLDRDEPDPSKISSISNQELPSTNYEDNYDYEVKSFLMKLPGINTRNVFSLMNHMDTLSSLHNFSIEELEEILSSSESAKLLHQTLHVSLASLVKLAINNEQAAKKNSLFSCSKKRKECQ